MTALVPVTVLGGYLGAGKTTIINRLLATTGDRSIAVLVNDFGAINIDAALIADAETETDGRTIALENGCVCCSIGDALGEALDRVLTLRPRPEQIIIEASGVADPAKIAVYGQGWPGCRLDAVVVVVDVETIRARADDQFVGSTVRRQLMAADVLLLTKTDLVSSRSVDAVRSWLATMASSARIVIVSPEVDVVGLLLDLVPVPVPEVSLRSPVDRDELPPAPAIFDSSLLTIDGPVTAAELEGVLDRLDDDVVRVKGFVHLSDRSPARHLVQMVGARRTIEACPSSDLKPRLDQLVVIRTR